MSHIYDLASDLVRRIYEKRINAPAILGLPPISLMLRNSPLLGEAFATKRQLWSIRRPLVAGSIFTNAACGIRQAFGGNIPRLHGGHDAFA